MDPFPASWGLVKRNLPGLLASGLYTLGSNYLSARRNIIPRQQPNLPMSTNYRRPIRMMRRRVYKRKFNKGMTVNAVKRIVRSTGLQGNALSLVATAASYTTLNNTLSQVQTSDLSPIYRLYRLRKVVLHIVPRVDTANSGVVNNIQCLVAACCDPETTAVPTTMTQVTAYDNSYQKFLTSADRFNYTFYPKVTNSVDISGTATGVGSYASNPWLRLDANGITVPHLSLKVAIQAYQATTIGFDYYFDYHFDVRGIA